jgi:hypothetical protein
MEGATDFVVAVVLPDLLQRPNDFDDHKVNFRSDEAALIGTTGLPVMHEHDYNSPDSGLGLCLKERNLPHQKQVLMGLEPRRSNRAQKAVYDVMTGNLSYTSLTHGYKGPADKGASGNLVAKTPKEISLTTEPWRSGSKIIHAFPSKRTLHAMSDDDLRIFSRKYGYPEPEVSSISTYKETLGRLIKSKYQEVTQHFHASTHPHTIMATEDTIVQASAAANEAAAAEAPPATEAQATQEVPPTEATKEEAAEVPAAPTSVDQIKDPKFMADKYKELADHSAKTEQEHKEAVAKMKALEARYAELEAKQKAADEKIEQERKAAHEKLVSEAERTLASYLQFAAKSTDADTVKSTEPMLRSMIDSDPSKAREYFNAQQEILVRASAFAQQADEERRRAVALQKQAEDEAHFAHILDQTQSSHQRLAAARREANMLAAQRPPVVQPTALQQQMESAIAKSRAETQLKAEPVGVPPVGTPAQETIVCASQSARANWDELGRQLKRLPTYEETLTGPTEERATGQVQASIFGGPGIETIEHVPKRARLANFGQRQFDPASFKMTLDAMRRMEGNINHLAPLP